jgi:hypothetical protein
MVITGESKQRGAANGSLGRRAMGLRVFLESPALNGSDKIYKKRLAGNVPDRR